MRERLRKRWFPVEADVVAIDDLEELPGQAKLVARFGYDVVPWPGTPQIGRWEFYAPSARLIALVPDPLPDLPEGGVTLDVLRHLVSTVFRGRLYLYVGDLEGVPGYALFGVDGEWVEMG